MVSSIGPRTKSWLVTLPLLAFLAAACTSGVSESTREAVPTRSCSAASSEDSGEFSVAVGGGTRTALVHVPDDMDAGSPPPLVLVFHGFAGSPEDMEAGSGMSAKADEVGFIAVYPAGLGSPAGWDLVGGDDAAFIEGLLASMAAQVCFDPRRVYASGFSMGGGMATAVGCRMADRIAAIAPVSGVNLADEIAPCQPSRPMPYIAFHGVLDGVLPYAGGPLRGPYPEVIGAEAAAAAWAKHNGCGSEPQPQPVINQTVEPMFWTGCAAPVEFYRITNRGHTWPGSPLDVSPETVDDINATDVIWDFLRDQLLPAR